MQSLGVHWFQNLILSILAFMKTTCFFELVDSKNLILRLSPNNMIRLTRFRKRLGNQTSNCRFNIDASELKSSIKKKISLQRTLVERPKWFITMRNSTYQIILVACF
jgi:hypothetical protein